MTREPQALSRAERDYHAAMRLLLHGLTGVNQAVVVRGSGLTRTSVERFLREKTVPQGTTVEAIAMFIWRTLNAHLLISDEDRQPTVMD